MARRRLTKKQKIAIGVGVTAAVGLTAAVLLQRRAAASPPILQGTVTPVSGLATAKRRLCLNPRNLTLEQRQILLDQVFRPLFLEIVTALPAQPGPAELDEALAAVADAALEQTCDFARPATVEAARRIAHDAWLEYTGASGQ